MIDLLIDLFSQIRGDIFLGIYAASFIALATLAYFWLISWDTSRNEPTPNLPKEFNPYEIAYLRAGVNEVTRLALISLMEKGYLQKPSATGEIAREEQSPKGKLKDPVEVEVFDWFSSPKMINAIFRKKYPQQLDPVFSDFKLDCENENLLASFMLKAISWLTRWSGIFLLTALAGLKLFAALFTGHTNVLLLIALWLGSVAFFYFLTRQGRLTNKGNRYLNNLRNAFGSPSTTKKATSTSSEDSSHFHPELIYPAALLGVGALSGTALADYNNHFKTDSSWTSSGSSCGADGGCGSSCGGDGGCGGGCGGCGGCGG